MESGARQQGGQEVSISIRGQVLIGDLEEPADSLGLVIFAHGAGSSRLSPRNRHVAARLREARLTTFLLDLLTPEEKALDERTAGRVRFDVPLLAERLQGASEWVGGFAGRDLRIGYFGASTGAAGALLAASRQGHAIRAVVCRGGRPDLAGPSLSDVVTPTLLVVGGEDKEVLRLNRRALTELRCESRLEIIPGATHLFPEPGALDKVADLAASWFRSHLADDLEPGG